MYIRTCVCIGQDMWCCVCTGDLLSVACVCMCVCVHATAGLHV